MRQTRLTQHQVDSPVGTPVDAHHEPEHVRSHAQSLGFTFNRFMVILARLIIMGLIANLTIKAFMVNPVSGLRSIAAVILPLLIIGYITFSSDKSKHLPRSPGEGMNFLIYSASAGWLVLVMVMTRYVIYYSSRGLPIGEFVLAITLGLFGYFSERFAFKPLFACAYGLISGFLIFVLVFGVPA
jgi:hypothetical protein